jgi:DNA-binding PadR family transcriptional regulator
MAESNRLSTTSYALLGQLSLRPWSGYDMATNVKRTLHWFWPRAESVLYAELKRLAALGLATATASAGRRGRPTQIYSITEAGREALAGWLADSEIAPALLHSEVLLRVHLAPFGTRAELLTALEQARDDGDALVRQALLIGAEFAAGRHQFQDQVHVRALLFDYLWSYGLGLVAWSERSIAAVSEWDDISGSAEDRERGRQRIGALVAAPGSRA